MAAARSSEQYVLDDYVARLLKDYDGTRDLHVAWDAGNGATGEAAAEAGRQVCPGKHLLLNEKIDGRFPAHHPDPTEPKNLVQLQEAVAARMAAISASPSMATATASASIDGKGRILWGDQLMVLLARRHRARRSPGATIIADVKASQVLFDEIARMGGTPLMWRTGHSLIKRRWPRPARRSPAR